MSTSEQIIIMYREKEWFYGLIVIVFYVVCVILFSLFLDKQNMQKYAWWMQTQETHTNDILTFHFPF